MDNTKFAKDQGSNKGLADRNQEKDKREGDEAEVARLKVQAERGRLQELKGRIEAMIEASSELRQYKKQLLLAMTPEGLRVQIIDEQNRPMFDSSSAELKPYTRTILRALGQELNGFTGKLSISGHTDAAQFPGNAAGYSNWELSSNRANACRRELILGGLDREKIIRVLGQAAILPLDRNDPFSAANRRISIVVLNKLAEERILRDGQMADEVMPGVEEPEVSLPPLPVLRPIAPLAR
jgi:chemotaxis protein MotB